MKYDDIIYLNRPKSIYPKMKISDRASQFAPFAALNGHDGAIKEAARIVDKKIELDETKKYLINIQLQSLQSKTNQSIKVTYFQKDTKKDGGVYIEIIDTIKKIDTITKKMILSSGLSILFDDLYDIQQLQTDNPE